jgi:phosphotriesterase-related protein
MSGRARTVLGAGLRPRYDTVLAHEHLLIDIRCWHDDSHAATRDLRDVLVTSETVARVRQNPFACLDNLVLDDERTAVEELARLHDLGSTLVIDVTPDSVGRDPARLASIARASGLDIVMGCGPYIAAARPLDDPAWQPERYRDELLAALHGDGPRPAVIGEIGTSDPILPVEAAALTGAAQAQAGLGGIALYVHLHPFARRGHEALDLVERAGGDLARTVLCHLDPQIPGGLDYHRSLLARGCTIAFDLWGDEDVYGAHRMPTDGERVDALLELIAAGFGAQLVHSHDVCLKSQLARLGGPGYAHIPRVVRPRLLAAGLSESEVDRQLAGNARALLG